MKIKIINAPEKIGAIVALRNQCGLKGLGLREAKGIVEGEIYELPTGIDPYAFIITLTATGATIATDEQMVTASLDRYTERLTDELLNIANKINAVKRLKATACGRLNQFLSHTGVQLEIGAKP